MSYWRSLLVLLLLEAGHQHLVKAMEACDVNRSKLPALVQPLNYELNLVLDPSSKSFSGKVQIDLNIVGTTDPLNFLLFRNNNTQMFSPVDDLRNIILSAEDLTVFEPEFHQDGRPIAVERICHDTGNKMLVVTLSMVPSLAAKSKLILSFKGEVKTEAKGLFKSTVESSQALVAQLKPAYARRVFPCFDEPQFKATFQVSIEYPERFLAVSNMPVEEKMTVSGYTTTHFKPTPKMSTYLLCFAVGEFEFKELTSTTYGTKIVGYAPTGSVDSVLYMLGRAVEAYDKVRGFFADLPQPLEMISIVAVNMEHRAVENWGLITMRWDHFSCSDSRDKLEDRNHAVIALTNVMVRFWLGNLVTIFRWDDLWFIEGLVNYLTNELTTDLYPEFGSEMYTLMNTVFSAMDDDDDPLKSRPIRGTRLKTADEIEKSYDTIIYKKSEAIFRMFAYYLGKDRFNTAIYHFIQPRAYKLATANDWLEVLSHSAPNYDQMREMLRQWTEQPGYPIITATKTGRGKLVVKQESNLNVYGFWLVPITYELHQGDGRPTFTDKYLLSDYGPAMINLPDTFDLRDPLIWLKLNIYSQGYYRVVYKSKLDGLKNALNRGVKLMRVSAIDRLHLISECYAEAKRDNLMDSFKELLKSFSVSRETNDGVMLLLTRILIELNDKNWEYASDKQVEEMLLTYHRMNEGISGEAGSNILKQYARGEVFYYLVVRLKVDAVIAEAKKYRTENNGLPRFIEHLLRR